jgi:hypothetical protein
MSFSKLPVLREVPARLTHDPDGRRVDRLSARCIENALTHFSHHVASPAHPDRQVQDHNAQDQVRPPDLERGREEASLSPSGGGRNPEVMECLEHKGDAHERQLQ